MEPIARRNLMTGGAAMAVAAAVPVATEAGAGGELAALVRLYFQQRDDFNANESLDNDEFDALAESTFRRTLRKMVGVPVRTADDSVAVLDFLASEETDLQDALKVPGYYGDTMRSLVAGLRRYLDGGRLT